jgi:hypothetical protein
MPAMTVEFAHAIPMSKIGLTKRRKIYATSEERKQRNRQAQAAFRERRTEYIKQLESTIKHHEETLQNLQNSHRNAADECLMLRYKNSLLERILLEKGKRDSYRTAVKWTRADSSTRYRRPGRAARKEWQSESGAYTASSVCTQLSQPSTAFAARRLEQTAAAAVAPGASQGGRQQWFAYDTARWAYPALAIVPAYAGVPSVVACSVSHALAQLCASWSVSIA